MFRLQLWGVLALFRLELTSGGIGLCSGFSYGVCWPLFRLELTSGGIGLGSVCWPLFRLELCSAHSEILNASIISTIMSSIISFFGLLILALCRLLILPSCRLRLHCLLSICRLWCTFCIGLGLFAFWNCLFFCSCWLELALFRLGWCALCRLSPPWFRRFWRFWSVLAFASCCTALVQAQGLFLPSPAFPSPWLAAATCEFLFSFLCSHNWQPNRKAPNALVQAHPFESAFSFQTFFWLTLGPCSAT